MKQYQVICGITDTLGELLKTACRDAGFRRVEFTAEVPKGENLTSKPALGCYMYHLQFAPYYKERNQSLVTVEDDSGKLVNYYRDSPLYLFAHYLLTAYGKSAREENLLLGLAMKTFLENPMIEGADLKGDCFYPDDQINVFPRLDAEYEEVLSFWRSMNEEVRPTVYYYVKLRIESGRLVKPGPEVADRDVRVR